MKTTTENRTINVPISCHRNNNRNHHKHTPILHGHNHHHLHYLVVNSPGMTTCWTARIDWLFLQQKTITKYDTSFCERALLTFHSYAMAAMPAAAPEPAIPMKWPLPTLLANRDAPTWKIFLKKGNLCIWFFFFILCLPLIHLCLLFS